MSHHHHDSSKAQPTDCIEKRTRAHACAALALALAGTLGFSQAAQARDDVRWSISIGVPAVPVYVEPAPVYRAPPPPPPRYVYVQPAPVIYGPPVYGYYDDRRGHGHRHHHHRHYRGYRDSDRDGVPDRYDRRPENPWKR